MTQILSEGFIGLSSLQEVIIPEGITVIGRKAFYNCIGMNTLDLPTSTTTIEQYAFYNTANLTSAVFPQSLKKIGAYAFYKSGLSSATLYYPSNWHTAAEYTVTGSRDSEFEASIPSGTLDFKATAKYTESSPYSYARLSCDISDSTVAAIALTEAWNGSCTYSGGWLDGSTVYISAEYYASDWNFLD